MSRNFSTFNEVADKIFESALYIIWRTLFLQVLFTVQSPIEVSLRKLNKFWINLDEKMFPDWLFCFYFIWPYRIRKAKSIPGVFLFTVSCSRQTLWNRGFKKEFLQADLLVQKAGNKIVADIALVVSIFWNSYKVRLINMVLIAEVCQKRVWFLSADSSSFIQHLYGHIQPLR